VLLTLALFAVGHGMLALSLSELAASRAAVRLVEAKAAADGAVAATLAGPVPAWLDSVPTGGSRSGGTWSFGRAVGSSQLMRLSREAWWVEAAGRSGSAEMRTARLVWALEPVQRILELRGAVTVGSGAPAVVLGELDAAAPAAVEPPLDASDCASWVGPMDAHYAAAPLAPTARLDAADTLPGLGQLDFAELLAATSLSVGGGGTPAPVEAAGMCVPSEPWNWGDPERPWRPCGAYVPLRGAEGDVTIVGGVGQAVLVADGDVTLGADARFYGLVVSRGALRLESGTQLVGLAVALGGVYIAAGARFQASACWAAHTLAPQRTSLGRPRVVSGTGRLGPLG